MKADLYTFDVGHGSCSLLRLFSGGGVSYTVLIDGATKSRAPAEQLPSLISGSGNKLVIDLVVLTHIHQDHCSGLAKIFDSWPGEIRRLWVPYPTRHLVDLAVALDGDVDVPDESNVEQDSNWVPRDLNQWYREACERLAAEDIPAHGWPFADGNPSSDFPRHVAKRLRFLLDLIESGDVDELEDLIHSKEFDCILHEMLLRHGEIAGLQRDFLELVYRYRLRHGWPIPAVLLTALALFPPTRTGTRARQIAKRYHAYSQEKPDSKRRKFVFAKTMSSYRSLNKLLKAARRRHTPVVMAQMCSGMVGTDAPFPGLSLRTIAPSYELIRSIEENLRLQQGERYYEQLYRTCLMQAANVIGGAVRVEFEGTSLLFPGDSDLQDVTDLDCDVLLCPHHAGHSASFCDRFGEQMTDEKSRTILVSKGSKGHRPSHDWISVFSHHRERLQVYCTQNSAEVEQCKHCDTSRWKQNEAIHLNYDGTDWTLVSKAAAQPRCDILSCKEVLGDT